MELYRTVLVEMPIGHYFSKYFSSELKKEKAGAEIAKAYNELEIYVVTDMLKRLWLEDFYAFTQTLGGTTAEMMKELLEIEADKRNITITLSSFGKDLNSPTEREKKR